MKYISFRLYLLLHEFFIYKWCDTDFMHGYWGRNNKLYKLRNESTFFSCEIGREREEGEMKFSYNEFLLQNFLLPFRIKHRLNQLYSCNGNREWNHHNNKRRVIRSQNSETLCCLQRKEWDEWEVTKSGHFYFFPTSLTPGWLGLKGWGRACCGCNCGCCRGLFCPPWFEPPVADPPAGDSSSSSSGAGVVGGGSHPGIVWANSHLRVVGLNARPAGQRWSRGYPPTHNQYLTQLLSMWTEPFGISLQIAEERLLNHKNKMHENLRCFWQSGTLSGQSQEWIASLYN